jgi:hypothetical protein
MLRARRRPVSERCGRLVLLRVILDVDEVPLSGIYATDSGWYLVWLRVAGWPWPCLLLACAGSAAANDQMVSVAVFAYLLMRMCTRSLVKRISSFMLVVVRRRVTWSLHADGSTLSSGGSCGMLLVRGRSRRIGWLIRSPISV